jgi:hypothetical protein
MDKPLPLTFITLKSSRPLGGGGTTPLIWPQPSSNQKRWLGTLATQLFFFFFLFMLSWFRSFILDKWLKKKLNYSNIYFIGCRISFKYIKKCIYQVTHWKKSAKPPQYVGVIHCQKVGEPHPHLATMCQSHILAQFTTLCGAVRVIWWYNLELRRSLLCHLIAYTFAKSLNCWVEWVFSRAKCYVNC